MPSEDMLLRIEKLKEYKINPDVYWIDAGWYGYSTCHMPNEFCGDWGDHTGSWVVNTRYHKNGLRDVSAAVHEAGMKFLLWFEPERVVKTADTPREHPDWFFKLGEENNTWILNLGNEEAYQGTLDMLTGMIEKLGIDCYRQDFNPDPLPFWRKNDEPERVGMNEIKHIMNLYRLWDALLERFPHLFIDNCASGGRRNDIELLSRSIPLWRSDYQCRGNYDPEASQIHTSGISWWIPYSGTGVGTIMGDEYRTRSAYSPAMLAQFLDVRISSH